MREDRAAEVRLDAADQQEHSVVEPSLDPGVMAGHMLRRGGLVLREAEQNNEHRRSEPSLGGVERLQPIAHPVDFPPEAVLVAVEVRQNGRAFG